MECPLSHDNFFKKNRENKRKERGRKALGKKGRARWS